MQAALRLTTTVLPGNKIEFTSPELKEGDRVDVILLLPERVASPPSERISMLELAETLPPGPRLFPTWEEYERFLQEEKNAWDR
ncbi:MAG TPA: hypothetical protein VFB38_22940 [Chthonomonadaceae bacterium]|nr:hypothetical protein [Chthonomonadaceae bacterium]